MSRKRRGGKLQFLWRQFGTALPPCLPHFLVGLHDRLRAISARIIPLINQAE
jgi:hypothetical protein